MIERGEPPPETAADLTATLRRLEGLRALIRSLAAVDRERTVAQVILDTAEQMLAARSAGRSARLAGAEAERPVVQR